MVTTIAAPSLGLDAATARADVTRTMNRLPVPKRPMLALLPLPMRRLGGLGLLTLTLWLAAFLAMIR